MRVSRLVFDQKIIDVDIWAALLYLPMRKGAVIAPGTLTFELSELTAVHHLKVRRVVNADALFDILKFAIIFVLWYLRRRKLRTILRSVLISFGGVAGIPSCMSPHPIKLCFGHILSVLGRVCTSLGATSI